MTTPGSARPAPRDEPRKPTEVSERQIELLQTLNGDDWRTPVYFDLVTEDLRRANTSSTLLEVGCGIGFDGDTTFQKRMADQAGTFIGVEPDNEVTPQPIYDELIRAPLHKAPIPAASIDIAYSVMVMEHLDEPDVFLDALSRVLKPGGVYWGFTVDRRHWYTYVANLMTRLNLKSHYLDVLAGKPRGEGRYHDYPTAYKVNAPRHLARFTDSFSRIDSWNVGPVSSAGQYAPTLVRPLVNAMERMRIGLGAPRTDFIVRLVR